MIFEKWWDWYWQDKTETWAAYNSKNIAFKAYEAGRLSILSKMSQTELLRVLNSESKI